MRLSLPFLPFLPLLPLLPFLPFLLLLQSQRVMAQLALRT